MNQYAVRIKNAVLDRLGWDRTVVYIGSVFFIIWWNIDSQKSIKLSLFEFKTYLAERGFDPRISGLWAQHASIAPLCCHIKYSITSKFNN